MPLDDVAERGALDDLREGRKSDALKLLMDAYGSELFRFCYSMMGNRDDAEDMLQQTFMQAFESFGQFSANASLRSWLYSISRNRCLDKLKASRRLRARIDFVDDPPERASSVGDAVESVGDDQLRRVLQDCVSALASAVRNTVLLRFQSEMSYPEIAAIMDEKPKTLQVRVARALPELRNCLQSHGIAL